MGTLFQKPHSDWIGAVQNRWKSGKTKGEHYNLFSRTCANHMQICKSSSVAKILVAGAKEQKTIWRHGVFTCWSPLKDFLLKTMPLDPNLLSMNGTESQWKITLVMVGSIICQLPLSFSPTVPYDPNLCNGKEEYKCIQVAYPSSIGKKKENLLKGCSHQQEDAQDASQCTVPECSNQQICNGNEIGFIKILQ